MVEKTYYPKSLSNIGTETMPKGTVYLSSRRGAKDIVGSIGYGAHDKNRLILAVWPTNQTPADISRHTIMLVNEYLRRIYPHLAGKYNTDEPVKDQTTPIPPPIVTQTSSPDLIPTHGLGEEAGIVGLNSAITGVDDPSKRLYATGTTASPQINPQTGKPAHVVEE